MKEDIKKFISETEKDLHSLTLTEVACLGAQNMLKMALAAEVQAHLDQYRDCHLGNGKPALVLNGFHLPRKVTVGEGQVTVSVPRTRRRHTEVENYASSIIPKYIRRSPKINEVIPWEAFRPLLNQVREKERKSSAGRKAFDVILMFKKMVCAPSKLTQAGRENRPDQSLTSRSERNSTCREVTNCAKLEGRRWSTVTKVKGR